jgi:hypothetical protein
MEEKKFLMSFTINELQVILNGLKGLPYEQVVTLINSIMDQHKAQIEADKSANKVPENESVKKE